MEHIRIIAPGDPGFDWLYDLYMQSFPVHEQRLRERQEGVLGHPEYHCDLLCQGETRVGLLMWWAGPGFRYVEHFAIAPQLRGQSWGSRALREFLAEGDPVVLEIDPPEDPVSRRRKGFYEGLGLVSGGTDNHLMTVDLRGTGVTGKELERRLDEVHITANKNTVPNDPEKPFVTSGVRIGTPAVTTRGFGPEEMRKIAKWIAACTFDFEAQKEAVAAEVAALTARFPLYE